MNLRRSILIAAGILVLLLLQSWWTRRARNDVTPLHSGTAIPALTADMLRRVPEADMLDYLQREGLRRMMLSGKGYHEAPAVLTPEACDLWIIGMWEERLCLTGFGQPLQQRRQSAVVTSSPTLEQLAEAYTHLGLGGPASIVRKAITQGLQPEDRAEDLAALAKEFRSVTKGSTAIQRRLYARQHLTQLFPATDAPAPAP